VFLNVGSTVKDNTGNTYYLDQIIGQGGFGYVFKAHREKDNCTFAVKTTLPSFGDASLAFAFKNEIESASKICCDNAIRYEYVHNGDVFPDYPPYIIMEYADKGTLKSLLDQRRHSNTLFTNGELVDIFKQLANGMSQINLSLVHRDIKPENILICGNTFKISDFGLSKVAAESTRTISFKGAGTPLYMAPEAWDLSKNTVQMDIYSMGIVFYELATLKYPYSPIPTTSDECQSAHLYSAIVSPSKFNIGLSPSLTSLIQRMVEKSVKRRFSTWDEILQILDVQTIPQSSIDEIVSLAVASKNAEDSMRQEQEATLERLKKEKEDHVKLVYSQFQQNIIDPIIDFAERVNLQYAGKDKLTFPKNLYFDPNKTKFSWKLNIPPNNFININYEVIFEENFVRDIPVDRIFGGSQTRRVNYHPKCKDKKILCWAEIVNKDGYGFNILLLESDGIYGDWFIMDNKNNLYSVTNKEKKEPFAFTLHELPVEIDKVQITHLYRAEFMDLSERDLLEHIQSIAFM